MFIFCKWRARGVKWVRLWKTGTDCNWVTFKNKIFHTVKCVKLCKMLHPVYNWSQCVKWVKQCKIVLWCTMLWYAVLCCAMLHNVLVCDSMLCYAVLCCARCRYVVISVSVLRYVMQMFCFVWSHGSLRRSLNQPLQNGFCYLTYGSFTMIYKRQVLLDKRNLNNTTLLQVTVCLSL